MKKNAISPFKQVSVVQRSMERERVEKKLVILGAGPGGYVAAIRAAQRGASVTLVERSHLGGTCLNQGCIPSKIMKTTAERLETMTTAGSFGLVLDGSARLDPIALQERKERILHVQRKGIDGLLRRHGVKVARGNGRIVAHGKILVRGDDGTETTHDWDRLILATGSCPLEIPAFPFDGKRVLSSDDALSVEAIPRSLIIVGGGVIGCEFAMIFSAFGSDVTIVEALDRLLPLPSVDADSSKVLQREMKKRKIKIHLRQVVERVEARGTGLAVHLAPSPFVPGANESPGIPPVLEAEKILVCVGRAPNTSDIGLETLGVETDEKGWIKTDDRMKTNVDHVYAIGDALGPAKVMLAHVASHEGIVAAENALGGAETMDYTVVPSAIFTSPEVAGVGLTEAQAREEGKDIRAGTFLFRNLGKAQVIGEIAGQAKIVFEAESGRILGIHLVGPHATDLISEGSLAVQTGCRVQDLARVIHPHPTLSEVMQEVAYKSMGEGIHG